MNAQATAGNSDNILKRREIRFKALPPGQTGRAAALLNGLPGLEVTRGPRDRVLIISYRVTDYTLMGIEEALATQGFQLDNTLYTKLMRALAHFCEETQLRNLRSPQRLIKKSNEVYVKVYDHHPHGDHDDTPVELREYR